jgi:putative flippase GtrA
MERAPAVTTPVVSIRRRAGRALRAPHNWLQLAKFSTVGTTGYLVNLAIFAGLLEVGLHYTFAAACSFLVAVTNNYTWNRIWTFRGQRGHFAYQGLRFLVVSLLALAANEVLLTSFVALGVGKLLAQAIAVVLVMPINFLGNKLWSFRRVPDRQAPAARSAAPPA